MDQPRRLRVNRARRNLMLTYGPAVAAVSIVVLVTTLVIWSATRLQPPVAADVHSAGAENECATPPNAHRNVTVEIPEVYELANVALSISAYADVQPHTVLRRGAYYEQVMRHFADYRAHPLIQRLNAELTGSSAWNRYYSFRENSVAYQFSGDSLLRHDDRRYWAKNLFATYLPLVQSFARETGFRRFFRDHADIYEQELTQYRVQVPVLEMWDWLERRFPHRYRQYRVVFSPLIKGSHSTQRFPDRGETVMFIAGTHIADEARPAQRAVDLARVVFTEIDHNYVNPLTDRHVTLVDDAFAALAAWNSASDRSYPTSYATFNEYMTWGVFSLYVRDRFPADVADAAITALERQMERRGFPQFAPFNRELLRIGADAECYVTLFEPMLRWSRQHANEQRPPG